MVAYSIISTRRRTIQSNPFSLCGTLIWSKMCRHSAKLIEFNCQIWWLLCLFVVERFLIISYWIGYIFQKKNFISFSFFFKKATFSFVFVFYIKVNRSSNLGLALLWRCLAFYIGGRKGCSLGRKSMGVVNTSPSLTETSTKRSIWAVEQRTVTRYTQAKIKIDPQLSRHVYIFGVKTSGELQLANQ